jgi:(S)-ureidoglycine aminohydrolase
MKSIALFVTLICFFGSETKVGQVESKVYSFSKAKVEKTSSGEKRQLINGETTHLENFEIHTTMLEPGKAPHGSQVHADSEEIAFIEEGRLEITLNKDKKVIKS